MSPETSPQKQLVIEVVNFGQRPMYLKSITGEVAGHRASFYEYYPQAKEAMRKLEPDEAADYTIDWQWPSEPGKEETGGIVEVETTRKRFTRFEHFNRITVTSNNAAIVVLLDIIQRKKVRPPRHK